MPELSELTHELTNLYKDIVDTKLDPDRMDNIDSGIWEYFNKQVPDDTFGQLYVKSRKTIYKSIKNTEDWWEEEYAKYERLIQRSIESVIEGAKEDAAMEREETGEEVDPYDIRKDELDDDALHDWFIQEWTHNIERRHWIANYFRGGDLTLNDVRTYGLEDAVLMYFVVPVEDAGLDLVKKLKDVVLEVNKTINEYHVIKWAFGDLENPIEW